MQIPRNKFACSFKEHCKWAKNAIIRFWWESGLAPASRNHLTTFWRPSSSTHV